MGTWDLGTRGYGNGDINMGRKDVWDGDAGTSNIGMQGTLGR